MMKVVGALALVMGLLVSGSVPAAVDATGTKLRGKATIMPNPAPFDPMAELRNIAPGSEEYLRAVFSCKEELCLYNSQKAPLITSSSLVAIHVVKTLVDRHIMAAAADDQELKIALEALYKDLSALQMSFAQVHYVVDHKRPAQAEPAK